MVGPRTKNSGHLATRIPRIWPRNIIGNNRVVQGALYGGKNYKPVQIDIGWICCRCLQTLNCPRNSFANRYTLNEIQLELGNCSFFEKEIVVFLWYTYWDSIFSEMKSSRIADKQRRREIIAQARVVKCAHVFPMLSNPCPILSLIRTSFISPFTKFDCLKYLITPRIYFTVCSA